MEILMSIIILIISLSVRDAAKALAAYSKGDTSSQTLSRLTLNPAVHADFIGSIIMPAAVLLMGGSLFGWSKPLTIKPSAYANKKERILVLLAGSMASLVLVAFAIVLLYTIGVTISESRPMIYTLISANLAILVFGLTPIFPFDGAQIANEFKASKIFISTHGNSLVFKVGAILTTIIVLQIVTALTFSMLRSV